MNTHVVTKALPKGNQTLAVGTKVDASEWRNTPLLVSQRYLKPLDAVAEPDGQTQPEASFEQQVIDVIKKNLSENGELRQLFLSQLEHAAPVRTGKSRS